MALSTEIAKKLIREAKERKSIKKAKHITVDCKTHTFETHGKVPQKYIPEPTGKLFHACDDYVRVLRGCYGSGKTTMCCAEIIFRTVQMPKCNDGIRRSRWAVIRNTYGDLVKTTLDSWFSWFAELGFVKTSKDKAFIITHKFNDGNGPIELTLIPIALNHEKDVSQRLKSLQVTGVYINELSELLQAVMTNFKGRLPRYPSKTMCPHHYWSGIIADTNAPTTRSWIYKMFENDNPIGHTMFHQPPALIKQKDGSYIPNPDAENIANLPTGYEMYMKMTYGETEEFINVYVMGNYGNVFEGQKVYPSFNDKIHVHNDLKLDPNYDICFGIDYGYTCPAVVLYQNVKGRMFVLKEFWGQYITIGELFCNEIFPYISEDNKDCIVKCTGDPANTMHGRQELQELGLDVHVAPTNKINDRISCTNKLLNTLIGGEAAIVIDRLGCPSLIEGFRGGYFYKTAYTGNGEPKDIPEKNHPYSDVHDALQYGCLDVSYADFTSSDGIDVKIFHNVSKY